MMEYTQELKKAYKTSVTLYIAFILSLVVYLIVFMVLKTRIPDFQGMMEKFDFPWLRYAFFALGLVQIFLIKFIRDTATKSITTVDAKTLINHLQRMSMISAALCEVPVILGFVLFFLSGNAADFYVLLVISFVIFVMYFPRYTNWEEWMKAKTSH
jgi:hypothetical protein